MSTRDGKSGNRRGSAGDAKSVLGNLPSTRPARIGRRREGTPSSGAATAAPAKPRASAAKPAATQKNKAARKPGAAEKPTAAPKPRAAKPDTAKPAPTAPATKPRAVRSGSPSLKRTPGGRTTAPPASGPPKGAELVTTAVQAAGELAQIGVTDGGQVLKRAVRRIPKP